MVCIDCSENLCRVKIEQIIYNDKDKWSEEIYNDMCKMLYCESSNVQKSIIPLSVLFNNILESIDASNIIENEYEYIKLVNVLHKKFKIMNREDIYVSSTSIMQILNQRDEAQRILRIKLDFIIFFKMLITIYTMITVSRCVNMQLNVNVLAISAISIYLLYVYSLTYGLHERLFIKKYDEILDNNGYYQPNIDTEMTVKYVPILNDIDNILDKALDTLYEMRYVSYYV